ncbi:MAG: cupin domain-containing protein [Sphingobium sp.]|nr:cupin domain-containing protein [Sphingobium sp.]MBP6111110.1 cupin domain-containing protein [Sphingobium sp.]MBP8670912.1 cupin domain-containing protein [Sphingobium sp.]MBP9157973.1 cupin domain-containing protein [Sphingobium sp.]MCC6482205.1 cupin domain-containing protein [Sphingomonadaceae bacterium]
MPKIDLSSIVAVNRTTYPAEYAGAVQGRWVRRLAPLFGLEDFGVSHVMLAPGAASSQRHWHEDEDELVILLSGEAVLIDDAGRTPLFPGDVAAFPKNDGNGHHVVNESDADCVFVAIGKPPTGACHYPDIDMHCPQGNAFTRKDGSAF